MVGVVDCLGGGFELIFSKLAPETVEHEFGGGFAPKGFAINLTMLFYILEIRVSVVNLKNWAAESIDTTKTASRSGKNRETWDRVHRPHVPR